MPRLLRTPQANDDLLAIWEYIARDSPQAADRFLRNLDETCKLLVENPKMGQLQEQYRPGLRCFSVGSYLIFYKAIEEGIEVYRVLHGARHLDRLL